MLFEWYRNRRRKRTIADTSALLASDFEDCQNAAAKDEVERFAHALQAMGPPTPAQLSQDIWVIERTAGKQDGYFVEFGAGNGVRGSNTVLLEEKHDWNGICAEPVPVEFELLRASRKCHCDPRCVWSTSGLTVEFAVAEAHYYSTISRFANCDSHAKKRASAKLVEVETISLNDLLALYRAPHRIDYVSIDTEGSELDILQAFDFAACQVGLMSVEHNGTASEQPIDDLMASRGFRRVFRNFTEFDAWYVNTAVYED